MKIAHLLKKCDINQSKKVYECEPVDCKGVDLKYQFKDEFNHLVNQLTYIQDEIEQITRQESDLKVGFLSGQLFSNVGNLRMKFWELENKLNNL